MALLGNTKSIEVPFRFALPDNLPSSFFYAGIDGMSVFRVEYILEYKFLGLMSNGSNLPDATLIK
jgi:hypothetical protein